MTRAKAFNKNNGQNRKSHSQPSNMSAFSKTLFSHFSVHNLQTHSKLIAWKSHLALKVAITSRCDVNERVKSRHFY